MSRQIVLDTETTGLLIENNNRIIEIGCVEIVDRKITNNTYHQYINPNRKSEPRALEVHGLTEEFLSDKPPFEFIAPHFLEFIQGAELIIHNAPFDIGFLNHELATLHNPVDITDLCTITDSLVIAKEYYPGARNSLDALCTRLGVNNDNRTLHGALLDSEILADVYLLMTGGQFDMNLSFDKQTVATDNNFNTKAENLPRILATEQELLLHHKLVAQFQDT